MLGDGDETDEDSMHDRAGFGVTSDVERASSRWDGCSAVEFLTWDAERPRLAYSQHSAVGAGVGASNSGVTRFAWSEVEDGADGEPSDTYTRTRVQIHNA